MTNLILIVDIVNLHPSKGTHWVCFINQFYFDSYGICPPQNILIQIKSKYNTCIYSEYQIQKQDSLCASYCLYVLYLTQFLGFKKAVLKFILSNKINIINEKD